jgi:hypothetical protein
LRNILLVAVISAILIAASVFAQQVPKPASIGQVGRYQLLVPPEHVGLAILLDTETGRTWHQVEFSEFAGGADSKASVWVPTGERVDNDKELAVWESKQTRK